MPSSSLLLITALLAGVIIATPYPRDSCMIPTPACPNPGPTTTYLPEPCFPRKGVCYPTNYYAAQDQGQFVGYNGAFNVQLAVKCRATCDSNSQCASYVGVINKAADNNLATGICYYYSIQQIAPRECIDAPSEIWAYYKQKLCTVTTTKITTTKSTTKSSSTTTKVTTTSSSTTAPSTTTSSSTTASSTTTSSSTTAPSTTTSSSTTAPSTTTSLSTTAAITTTNSSTIASTTTTSSTTIAATCTKLILQVTGGAYSGKYLSNNGRAFLFTTAQSASPYILSGTTLFDSLNPSTYWLAIRGNPYIAVSDKDYSDAAQPMVCSMGSSPVTSSNNGSISCTDYTAYSNILQTCKSKYEQLMLYYKLYDSTCSPVTLGASCAS